jgi:signal transduction histidine kinase
MSLLWILVGALASGPLWIAGTYLAIRRLWLGARELKRRARGQEHLAQVGQLVGGLAHEIKNPLSTINLNLRLLSEDLARYGDDDHARLLRRLRSVQHESDRLKSILDDFLRFAGKFELTLETVDLRGVVDELTDFFSPQAESGRVVLRAAVSPHPVYAKVDVDLIKQAILNLLINALQAMPEGGELIVAVRAVRSRALIEVTDTGPGMDVETRAKIFDIYYSTKKGGTGLGLPTTQRIVREHHGRIAVDTEPGKGTRFSIELPLADAPEQGPGE